MNIQFLIHCAISSVCVALLPSATSPIVHKSPVRKPSECANHDGSSKMMNYGLLMSSFSDGVLPSSEAERALRYGFARAILAQERIGIEEEVRRSAVQSPCCGPSIPALDKLQEIDDMISLLEASKDNVTKIMLPLRTREFRMVYIPTAMYARRPESQSSPGKQRQRAKADARKRRTRVASFVSDLMDLEVQAVTIDLNDGSAVHQFDEDTENTPRSGKEWLTKWNPHLVYVEGGNTFWLHHCMVKGDWRSTLIDVCTNDREAVYVGSSAGAILAGQGIETACWKGWDNPGIVPGMEAYRNWQGVEGLQLIDASIFPHMSQEWESLVESKINESDVLKRVIPLRDDQVCLADGRRNTIEVLDGT